MNHHTSIGAEIDQAHAAVEATAARMLEDEPKLGRQHALSILADAYARVIAEDVANDRTPDRSTIRKYRVARALYIAEVAGR